MLDWVTVQTRDADWHGLLVVNRVNVFFHRYQAPREASASGLSFLLSLTGHVIGDGHKAR